MIMIQTEANMMLLSWFRVSNTFNRRGRTWASYGPIIIGSESASPYCILSLRPSKGNFWRVLVSKVFETLQLAYVWIQTNMVSTRSTTNPPEQLLLHVKKPLGFAWFFFGLSPEQAQMGLGCQVLWHGGRELLTSRGDPAAAGMVLRCFCGSGVSLVNI